MLIKKSIKPLLLFILAAAFTNNTTLNAQVVWENHTKEVYNYLSRMAQKGVIRFDDNIRPLSKKYISDCLDSVSHKINPVSYTHLTLPTNREV